MKKRKLAWVAAGFVALLAFAIAGAASSSSGSHVATAQGCVNQGSDVRVGGSVVCWAQRHLSWKSEREPHFLLIGREDGTSLGLAWPRYAVYNSPSGGGWRMFRVGFRYDRTWHGYIFPTAAWKIVSSRLMY